jgi:hypothetical protein
MPDEIALARGWFLKSVTARLLAATETRFSVASVPLRLQRKEHGGSQ